MLVTTQAIGAKSLAVRDDMSIWVCLTQPFAAQSILSARCFVPSLKCLVWVRRSDRPTRLMSTLDDGFYSRVTVTIGGVSMPVERVSNGSLQITIDVEKPS